MSDEEKVRHNHLDQQRRKPGECEACDILWIAQKERTRHGGRREKAEREIDLFTKQQAALADYMHDQRDANGRFTRA